MTFQAWLAGVSLVTFALLIAIYPVAEMMGNLSTGIAGFFSSIFGPIVSNSPFFVYWLLGQLILCSFTELSYPSALS